LSIFVVVIKTEYIITCPHLVETTLVASRANQQVYRYMARWPLGHAALSDNYR